MYYVYNKNNINKNFGKMYDKLKIIKNPPVVPLFDGLKPGGSVVVLSNELFSSLPFESLHSIYSSIDSEKWKRVVLNQMAKNAKTFDDWLFILGHSVEKNTHCMAEKKAIKLANSVSALLLLLKNYNMTGKKQVEAIKKMLKIADDEELLGVKSICARAGMMIEYHREETRRALLYALS